MGLVEVLKSLADIERWDYSDRRSTLRIPCHLRACMKKGKTKLDVDIVDISLLGIKAHIKGKARKGSTYELHPGQKGKHKPISCRIEWKVKEGDGFVAGISFQETEETMSSSWLFEEIVAIGNETVKTEQRREGVRVACELPARVRKGHDWHDVQFVDLGFGGALLKSENVSLKTGEKVRLDFGPYEDLTRVVINSEVIMTYEREVPRFGVRFHTFNTGGVTDLLAYLDHFTSGESK